MPNRLSGALSPYLEQHADNPVDWYPWGPEALEAARTADLPILLSIGYSACHWCHVMAHESFENEEIAERMNDWFVNIKVDREERPDLDRIYQLAHQLLTGRGGGWPLTVFLDPADLAPFVAGTYFPPTARHGLIGFGELLQRVHGAWLDQRDTLKAQNRQLQEALSMISAQRTPVEDDHGDPEQVLLGQLDARRDRRHGGFGDAPKFPQAPMLEWLLGTSAADEQAADMLGDALDAMADNGLFDHLGGGFFRYCVDAAWEIPHFEKMLYDNAQLLPLYAEASVRFDNSMWADTAALTAEFLSREFRLPDGGLASSLDADSLPPPDEESRSNSDSDSDSDSDSASASDSDPDSESSDSAVEGAYYVWTPNQFEQCLDADRVDLAKARYGLDGPPNFEGGKWHLVRARSLNELTRSAGDAERTARALEMARGELLACRQARPAPARDDKMLAGTNALAAAGLMRAGRLLGNKGWLGLGVETASLTWQRLFAESPARAVWRDGRRDHPALLDDYAAMLLACMECLQCRWDPDWLERAEQLAAIVLDRFFDNETDTLYLTPIDHERLIMRPTANTDDATPAGAALAARALARLGHLIASGEWLALAGRIVDAARGDMQRTPAAHSGMLIAARELEKPHPQVLVGGRSGEADDWHAQLTRRPGIHPYRVRANGNVLPDLLGEIAETDSTRAVVCLGTHCLEPADSFERLEARLAEAEAERAGRA